MQKWIRKAALGNSPVDCCNRRGLPAGKRSPSAYKKTIKAVGSISFQLITATAVFFLFVKFKRMHGGGSCAAKNKFLVFLRYLCRRISLSDKIGKFFDGTSGTPSPTAHNDIFVSVRSAKTVIFLFAQTFCFSPKVVIFGSFCISCLIFSPFFNKLHLAENTLPWYNSAVCVLGS